MFTLEELVAVLFRDQELEPETRAKLADTLRQEPQTRPLFDHLEALAHDAGVDDLEQGYALARHFERIAHQPWASPSQLADALLQETDELPYAELLRLAEAHLLRAEGAAVAHLGNVRQGLELAARLARRADEALEGFLTVLTERNPEAAGQLLERLLGAYKRHRGGDPAAP
jgi:hypothetical protein